MNLSGQDMFIYVGYAVVAIAYGWAFAYSVSPGMDTRLQRNTSRAFAVFVGALWPATMPLFAFVSMILVSHMARESRR